MFKTTRQGARRLFLVAGIALVLLGTPTIPVTHAGHCAPPQGTNCPHRPGDDDNGPRIRHVRSAREVIPL